MNEPFKYIDRMGVEIEGGWDVTPHGMHGDGSVSVAGKIPGEVVSRPLGSMDEVAAWMKSIYPSGVNHSCGLHVHFSFKGAGFGAGAYSALTEKRFRDYFKNAMVRFGVEHSIKNKFFWSRLDGENTYCKDNWEPERQMRVTGKDSVRYAQWNFCFLVQGRHTAECRLLPTFKNCNVAVTAVRYLAKIVEDYLDAYPSVIEFPVVAMVEGNESETVRVNTVSRI